jgi:hypothetical protein
VIAQPEQNVALAHAGIALDEDGLSLQEGGDDLLRLGPLDELAPDKSVASRIAEALVRFVDPGDEEARRRPGVRAQAVRLELGPQLACGEPLVHAIVEDLDERGHGVLDRAAEH